MPIVRRPRHSFGEACQWHDSPLDRWAWIFDATLSGFGVERSRCPITDRQGRVNCH